MLTETAGPDYQRVASDIRERIRSGEYQVGAAIPSTPDLEKHYGVSKTPVRQAVEQLKREGILDGHPGKRVYVKATPAEAEAEQRDLKAIGEEVAELKGHVAGYEDLRERVERTEATLMEIYARLGWDRPQQAGNDREASREHAG